MKIWPLLLLFQMGCAYAQPLWSNAQKSGNDFLVGTIHVGDERVRTLPVTLKQIIDRVDVVVVEVDLSNVSDLEQHQALRRYGLLPDTSRLQDLLSADVYQQMQAYFAAHQSNVDQVSRFKPWLAALTMVQMQYQAQGFRAEYGIDLQILSYARQQGKKVIGLESLTEQFALFDQLMAQQSLSADEIIVDALEEITTMKDMPDDMLDAWLRGDVQAFERIYQLTLNRTAADKVIADVMLNGRNQRWLSKIKSLVAEKSVLVAVGTLHYVGPQGLPVLLNDQFITINPDASGE